jgi:hypothetical protein
MAHSFDTSLLPQASCRDWDNNSQFYSEYQWEANTPKPLVAGSSDGGKVYGEIEEEMFQAS